MYNQESDASAAFGLFIRLMKHFPQNSRSVPGVQGIYLVLQEFSRALEENFKSPGIPGAVSTS